MDFHRLAQKRSLMAHRELANRIESDPQLIAHAKATLARWIEQDRLHPEYATKWAALLKGPSGLLRSILVDDSDESRDLRQTSPFAGCLTARERWRMWKETKAAA